MTPFAKSISFAPQFGQFAEQERFWPHQWVPAVWTATPDSMII
jgi:hypothetical protein